MTYKYFNENDFLKANPPCEISQMNEKFLHKLDACRELAGIPFRVTSAFRTIEHEISRKRSGKSAHTLGVAVDVACTDSISRFKIIKAALEVGINRIGIAKTFIHLDLATKATHAQNVIFDY